MIAFLWVFVLFNGFKLLNGFRNIKDHDEYSYFVIESTYNEIKEFITTDGNSEYKYENGLYGFEDTHHVISTPKKLVKRAFSENHKFFENKKIHTLNPETRLFKRTPGWYFVYWVEREIWCVHFRSTSEEITCNF